MEKILCRILTDPFLRRTAFHADSFCVNYSLYAKQISARLQLYHFKSCWEKRLLLHTSRNKYGKKQKNVITYKPKPKYPSVQLWSGVTVAEISRKTNRELSSVFEALSYNEDCSHYRRPTDEIHDKAHLRELAHKLGYRVEFINLVPKEKNTLKKIDLLKRPRASPEDLVKRPPVVTIMGHVDHGKTTLLDSLRKTSVAAFEHGGITQHIGAFTVKVGNGFITFLDTPGHAAFHSMRSRGANATDIVVLVVAADDGIMEQTVESIKYAQKARVPIIVAINKIDKPNTDIDQVKQQLLNHGLQVEDLGGEIQAIPISALKNQNLNHLIEAIITLSEVMEIGGDPKGSVEGVVLESSKIERKGKVTTALIERGTLKKGSILVAGTSYAKVRDLLDERNAKMTEATPGMPVQILGWKSVPAAGDIILEAESEKKARQVIEYRQKVLAEKKAQADSIEIQKREMQHLEKYRKERKDRLEKGRYRKERSYFREKEIVWDTSPSISLLIKGDVHGSIEAIMDVINSYEQNDECKLDVISADVGNVTETDVGLAETFGGIIYCFDVKMPTDVKLLAEEKEVRVKTFNVIYHLIDDVKMEINAKLPLLKKEDITGEATVLQEFIINDGKLKVPVAGCRCTKGTLRKGNCKVKREDEVIYQGTLISLRHEKADVETIKTDVECGLRIEDPKISFLPGDIVICYLDNYVTQTTSWDPGF